MRKNILVAALLACALPLLYFIGCNNAPAPTKDLESAQANVSQAEADLATAKAEYNQELDNFKREMAERNEANNQAIASFKELSERQQQEARAAYKAKIAELEQKNVELKGRLYEFKGDGQDKWAAFKDEFSRDMDELGNAIKDFGKKNVK